MSNILVIKHGALGDVVQISGALKDIRNAHPKDNIILLTSSPYKELFSICPYIDDLLIDNRESFFKINIWLKLRKAIKRYKFNTVYDLQNSYRTDSYKKYMFSAPNWSSILKVLQGSETKESFKEIGAIDRMDIQLKRSGIETKFTKTPDFSWAIDMDFELDKRIRKDYIYIAPFASANGTAKTWPYFSDLIKTLEQEFPSLDVVSTPGPSEIEDAKKVGGIAQLYNGKAIGIRQMAKVIKGAKFVISNDTGPAHIAAHLGCKGLVLFGSHTTPKKTSIETQNFKALSVKDLKDLEVEEVYRRIKAEL
jgi:ADP-heptose:LPS heptosyltransferase